MSQAAILPIYRAMLFSAALLLACAARAHDGQEAQLAPEHPAAEALIHTAPGAAEAGAPKVAEGTNTALLRLRVLDAATGAPTHCRVNVIGADGNYYEPDGHLLAPWSLHRLGNRAAKGPFRYYGWFFYSDGEDEVRVPRGQTTIEVWKGFEYRPMRMTLDVAAEETATVTLTRMLDMAAKGWYVGDPHIHLNRRDATDEARALDLVAAEDIRYGFLLGMNDARTFSGVMEEKGWPQLQGMGDASVARRGAHLVTSGYEYRNTTYGHILLLMADDLVFKNQVLQVDEWPTFAEVARETHRLNGYAIHAHGGYEKEIYADYIPGATDGVELLQFAVYRGIGLEGWYHILNAGYRFPAVGASDFPYCRALGDCRTYVKLGEDTSARAWAEAAVVGRSFFTTGPMLDVTVDGAGPGETVLLAEDHGEPVAVVVNLRSEVAPVSTVEIIVNGALVHHAHVAHTLPQASELHFRVPVEGSTWIGVRAHGEQMSGLPDAEAHTNPVFVLRGDQPILDTDSVAWLLRKLDGRIAAIEALADFERKGEVLGYFQDCRVQLAEKLGN